MTDIHNNTEIGAFDLKAFFPYQVRVFYTAVSQSVADIYSKSHGLTVNEWRVMSVLGNRPPLSASEAVDHSSLDKVQVSRAIKGLLKSGLLERRTDGADRRRVHLILTARGREIFLELVPMVAARERELLQGLSPAEQETLKALMARVRENAEICLEDRPA